MERDGVIGLHMVRPSARPGDMDTEVEDMLASGWSVPAGPDGEYVRGGAALETLITGRKGLLLLGPGALEGGPGVGCQLRREDASLVNVTGGGGRVDYVCDLQTSEVGV